MKTFRSILFLALSAAALACGSSSHEPDTTPPIVRKADKVDIAIASVTLADDCGSGPTTAPPPPPADEPVITAQAQAKMPATASARMAAGASISAGDRACEQSSIQLRVVNSTGAASKVAIQKIEVYDAAGTKVADLTPRAPSKWSDDSYQAWDEQVDANAELAVSYALNAPYLSRGATYTVRVVVASAEGDKTLEQPVTLHAEASLPPGVVT